MAEQTEPVRRKVALKVIKPGMDTRQVVARFEAERQALALMDHPHIAKVLRRRHHRFGIAVLRDGAGQRHPDHEFCDDHQLLGPRTAGVVRHGLPGVTARPSEGIIHRDLKPSNVLVTLHDDQPVPKVIDFGVAKATSGQLTDKTLFTGFMQMVGTPLYMSPEQAEMSGLDVDTRSDIYSLGVLLYELLTGMTPFDRDRLNSAAMEEVRRIIREEEPNKLNTRDEHGGGLVVSGVSEKKGSVGEALEKDRTRRYETANGFARDVQRYLSDELVEARPPSSAYRLRKAIRRNKVALTTAGLVSLGLIVGTTVSIWQAIRAAREQAELAPPRPKRG